MIAWYANLLLGLLLGARSVTCPSGFVLSEGVRASGAFTCSRWARRSDCDDAEPLARVWGYLPCAHPPTMDLTATIVRCVP